MKYLIPFLFAVMSCNAKTSQENSTSQKTSIPENENKITLIELFTSQGCSSCPPADKVLKIISDKYSLDKVIPLSFHVDYWNRLGWKDPYSQPEFTERQKTYAEILNLNGVYTPQAVINGKFETIGSNQSVIENQILKNINSIERLNINDILYNDKKVSFNILNKDIKKKEQILLLEVNKKEANAVPRGENSGRKLEHSNVVKFMYTMSFSSTMTFNLNNIKSSQNFLVIIVENKNTHQINYITTIN